MNKTTKELLEMIKNADPFKDEFWDEVLSEQAEEFVSNFSLKDWMDVVSCLPQKSIEMNYCLLELILDSSPNEIVTLAIEKMIDMICQDEDFIKAIYYLRDKDLKLNLNEEVKAKLKNACNERLRTIKANIKSFERELKSLETFTKNL